MTQNETITMERHDITYNGQSVLANYIKNEKSNNPALTNKQLFVKRTNLYKMVVFPAPSSPRIRILSSFWPKSEENKLEKKEPACENKNPLRKAWKDILTPCQKTHNTHPYWSSAQYQSHASSQLIAWLV